MTNIWLVLEKLSPWGVLLPAPLHLHLQLHEILFHLFYLDAVTTQSRGLEYDSEVSNQRRRFWSHSDMIPGRWNHVPATWLRLTWWFCWNIGHEGWISFSQAVCFTIMKQGTSSFMTSALDALVFVKVCNLWWVSDKVPQGRGVAPVQLLSKITPDSMTRKSNFHTLTGNSFKYLFLGSRFLLAFCFRA